MGDICDKIVVGGIKNRGEFCSQIEPLDCVDPMAGGVRVKVAVDPQLLSSKARRDGRQRSWMLLDARWTPSFIDLARHVCNKFPIYTSLLDGHSISPAEQNSRSD